MGMNRDDIIRIAHEAGMTPISHVSTADVICSRASLERFANLVAAAEREACAKVCMDKWMEWMDASPDKRLDMRNDAEDCAFAIRERGAP
jgi:hypothetical protein